jgi:hypothetical protein
MRALSLLTLGLALGAGPALAQDSAQNASAAGGASSEVATHLTASGVQTAIGVSAVPAGVAGAASVVGGSALAVGGSAVAGAGAGLSEAAGASAEAASGPLKVDDRVVVSPDPAPKVPYDAQKPKPQ